MSLPLINGCRACNPLGLKAGLQTCPYAPAQIAHEAARRTYAILIGVTLRGPRRPIEDGFFK
jgi:hypothetical protein